MALVVARGHVLPLAAEMEQHTHGPFGSPPRAHQLEDLIRSAEAEGFGLLWEMGLGKTWELIHTACHLWRLKKIDAMLVLAPNGVHENFAGELHHLPPDVNACVVTYRTEKAKTKSHQQLVDAVTRRRESEVKLYILVMSYDGVRTDQGYQTAVKFIKAGSTLGALDESTAIKTPSAKVSKRVAALGKLCAYRRIMDGTPIAESPFDIYHQIKFLYPDYWHRHGMGSFWVFKQTFGVFKTQRARAGHQYQEFLQYQNLDKLQKLISDVCSRRLKEDCLDLPPKVYKKVTFRLAPEQAKLYDELRKSTAAEFGDGRQVEARTALARLLRLQQVTCGYAATVETPPEPDMEPPATPEEAEARRQEVLRWYEEERPPLAPDAQVIAFTTGPHEVRPQLDDVVPPERNPRLQMLLSLIERTHHKSIVFCRFTRDVDLITQALGNRAIRYDGKVGPADREAGIARFKGETAHVVLVCNIAALSRGRTLTEAKTVFYYSNTFSLIHRLQSEDRAHRIGQTDSVLYIDLVAEGTVDEHIVHTLREKYDVAAVCSGDKLREWIK